MTIDAIERQLAGLREHTELKNQLTIEKVNQTIDKMKASGQLINFETVAREANVSRSTLYGNSCIKERIYGIRVLAEGVQLPPPPPSPPKLRKPREKQDGSLWERICKLESDKKKLIAQLVDIYELKEENERLRKQLQKRSSSGLDAK